MIERHVVTQQMTMRRMLWWIALALLSVAGAWPSQAAEPRTALVIGNAAYSFAPLANPGNDASDIAAALRGAGFNVTLKLDADRGGIAEAIRSFGESLRQRRGMGLFYFAGHGVQIGGESYLVPVGDRFAGEADLTARAVKATDVVDAMAAAGSQLNVVILDACRDNALGKTGTRGLSRIDSNARLFISYSTSPGAVAEDGSGRNSPYTKHLAQAIATPDLSLEQTFKATLKGVHQETRGRQTPWISSSFFGDFTFRPTGRPATLSPGEGAPPAVTPGSPRGGPDQPGSASGEAMPATLTGIYRVDGRNPGGSPYRGMVAITQEGDRFAFKWWIGSQVFDGTGHLAGRMLLVNWGGAKPVIYTLGARGSLDGEWADGSATERLTLHARAADQPVTLGEGAYAAVGYGGGGGRYEGQVAITRLGERYRLAWTIGATEYRGEGVLEGNLLTVDWGSATPVVYAVDADGRLSGLWDAGAAEETLTRMR